MTVREIQGHLLEIYGRDCQESCVRGRLRHHA
jgi:hypothetical protein